MRRAAPTGTYRVDVSRRMDDDYADGTGTTGTVAVGGFATGRIEATADQDWFAVELLAGVEYRIDLRGSHTFAGTLVDPYLLGVWDGATKLFGSENDDGGEGFDSRLSNFRVEADGTYHIVVSNSDPFTGLRTTSSSRRAIASSPRAILSSRRRTTRVPAGSRVERNALTPPAGTRSGSAMRGTSHGRKGNAASAGSRRRDRPRRPAALDNPRGVDMDLVQAWQARRALDYLVGYGLSPVLWRKLPGCRSAGRVQSVALRLICEREAGIEAFVPRQYWTVEAEAAAGDGVSFAATLVRLDGTAIGETGMAGEAAARKAAGRIREARFRAVAVERDTLHRPPNPPFATATLQLAAFRRLGLGVGETMAIAQRLYEGVELGAETTGLITYPRTDSSAMARAAVAQARAAIAERFGADCVPARARTFRTRARNAQEAHEAIRPTGFGRTPESVARHLDRDAAGLYGLIWHRALASQMAAARVERVRIELAGEDGAVALAAECSAMVFDGHFRLAPDRDPGVRATEGRDPGDAGTAGRGLPALEAGEAVTVRAVRAERHVAAPPERHTEAGLVRRLEEHGIGRPSTWAAILAVLQARGYAVLHERCLVPTERGRTRNSILNRSRPSTRSAAVASLGRGQSRRLTRASRKARHSKR